MGIKGHKERALLRRGINIQDALKRRSVINENSLLRRNSLNETYNEDIRLDELCKIESEKNLKSVYCKLSELLNTLPISIAQETYDAILTLYYFFKPKSLTDSRVAFNRTIKSILNNENPSNQIILIAKFLNDPDFSDDDVKKALIKYRNGENPNITEKDLESILKNARFKEYSKYEESFKGGNFELLRGSSKLSHGYKNAVTGKPETFFNLILDVFNGNIDINTLITNISDSILKTDISDLLYKSDLITTKNLTVNGEVLLPSGSKIEVKKFNPQVMDSYFSEYFSIYKNSDIPEIAHTPQFKNIYNKIINSIFNNIKDKGQKMLDDIHSDIDGIMFDKNILILKDDFEFYWSNKGQRGCGELRLSVRFRIKNSKITAYQYDFNNSNTELTPIEFNLTPKSKIYC